jgi:oxaloacetate decarboxylase alpha subunit
LIEPEVEALTLDVQAKAKEKGISLCDDVIDDVLTVALFEQVGWKFLENRHNPEAFEPVPTERVDSPAEKASAPADSGVYTVNVNNQAFVVRVNEGADPEVLAQSTTDTPKAAPVSAKPTAPSGNAETVAAPLAGNIWKVHAKPGDEVKEGQVLLILEAMKMETEIRASRDAVVDGVSVSEGDAVQVGDALVALA